MACSTKTLKVFSLLWDIIYALLGVAAIAIGIYVILQVEHFNNAAFIVLGLGVIVILVASFGSLGALRESSRLLKTFSAVLVILVVLQILIVGYFWLFKPSIEINADRTFDEIWRSQPVPIKPGNVSEIASIEKWLDCCGNVGPVDYILPPHSCYDSNVRLNLRGCRVTFREYISDNWAALNIFVAVLVLAELICAIFAHVLANSILNRWRRSKYYPK